MVLQLSGSEYDFWPPAIEAYQSQIIDIPDIIKASIV